MKKTKSPSVTISSLKNYYKYYRIRLRNLFLVILYFWAYFCEMLKMRHYDKCRSGITFYCPPGKLKSKIYGCIWLFLLFRLTKIHQYSNEIITIIVAVSIMHVAQTKKARPILPPLSAWKKTV